MSVLPPILRRLAEKSGYVPEPTSAHLQAIAMSRLGIKMQKVINTQGDSRVDEVCRDAEADGWVSMEHIYANGQPHSPLHPNCRCWTQYREVRPRVRESALPPLIERVVRVAGYTRNGRRIGGYVQQRAGDVRREPGEGAGSTHFGVLTAGEVGDRGESVFARVAPRLGARFGGTIRPVASAPRADGSRGSRTTPFDFATRTTGIEVKTISIDAKNQKTAIKREEIDRKVAAAKAMGLKNTATVVLVIDPRRKRVHVYGVDGIRSMMVSQMEFYGSYSLGAWKK